jgi:hypothetical protein
MSLLYRTPNVVIDRFEWQCSVELREKGRIRRYYRFRPLSVKPMSWQPISQWKGRLPTTAEFRVFGRMNQHIIRAERSVEKHAAMARKLLAA